MNINRSLPPHILQVIFSKLFVVNLPICRLVCRFWNHLILEYASIGKISPDSFFLTTNGIGSKLYCIEFDPKYLEGFRFFASSPFIEMFCSYAIYSIANTSCKGLFLVFKTFPALGCAGILNPLTKQYLKLPYVLKNPRGIYYYGFGFSPNTNCYKIVRVSIDLKKSLSIFDVFTIGGRNQLRIRVYSTSFHISNHGIFFNGALYWIGVDKKNGYEYVICRFDVEKEMIESIVRLSEVAPSSLVTLQAFNGSLYATFFYMYPCYKIGVWRMVQGCGRRVWWRREFVIDDMPNEWVAPRSHFKVYIQLLKAYEDGKILCLVNYKFLIFYYPKTRRLKIFNQVPRDMEILSMDSFRFDPLQNILVGGVRRR